MSRKDYQALAAAMYRAKPPSDCLMVAGGAVMLGQWAMVLDELIPVLRGLNPRFNAELFREACETGRCRGMRAA